MEQTIDRIRRMEGRYDRLLGGQDCPEALRELARYMESGLWLRDYELDEQGLLPPELKRGVLSQDGLYALLEKFSANSQSE